jgi:Uroporphyrinogen-III synthase
VVHPLLLIQHLKPTLPPLGDYAALAFTSGHGVRAFCELTPERDLPVHAVGDGTALAAHLAGFGQVDSAEGDIHALAKHLNQWPPGGPLLCPGATVRAADLNSLVPAIRVDTLDVYKAQENPAPFPVAMDAVLLQSPRAARHLARLWPKDRPMPSLVALSPAVADALMPHGPIFIADRPNEESLMLALGKALARV